MSCLIKLTGEVLKAPRISLFAELSRTFQILVVCENVFMVSQTTLPNRIRGCRTDTTRFRVASGFSPEKHLPMRLN